MLSANSLALALFDLACLVTGTVNIPIPANSTPPQIAAIWKDADAGVAARHLARLRRLVNPGPPVAKLGEVE